MIEKSTLASLVGQKLSQRKIAETLGCSQCKVRRWLGKHDLRTTRTQSGTKLGCARKPRPQCLNCGATCANLGATYCCSKCQRDYEYKHYVTRWKEGEERGYGVGPSLPISSYVRRYLFEKYKNRCCKCGWSEINTRTGRIPLQINHANGDAEDCSEGNLELLCPNCHSLTYNFGSLNRGKNKRTHR